MSIVELNVPFKENECVKALGAKWNAEMKVWYVTTMEELTPFRQWLPTGTALLRIFLKVEEDKHERKEADKKAAIAFEEAKGEAANIFAISKHMGNSYNEADAVCSFIYMHAWPRSEKTIQGMHLARSYMNSKGITMEECVAELKKLRVPYEYGAGRVC